MRDREIKLEVIESKYIIILIAYILSLSSEKLDRKLIYYFKEFF